MNLSMLSSTIQGMEVQRSTINTLRAFVDSAASMDLGALRDSGAASPLEVVLGLKPAPGRGAVRRRGQGRRQRSGSGSRRRRCPGGGSRPGRRAALCRHERTDGAAAQSASKAWWDLLQQQFGQIAAATAATMPAAAPSKVESEADKPAPKAAKTAAKPPSAGQAGLEGRRPRKPAARKAAPKTEPSA